MKRLTTLALALAVVLAPAVRADDDDEMPDGDADLVEKPKKDQKKKQEEEKRKKEEQKRKEEERKKAEDEERERKKAADEQERQERQEREAKKKEEAKKKDAEAKKKPPRGGDDDDDILTGDDPPPRRPDPKADPKAAPKTGKDPLLEDVLADSDEDDLPAGSVRPREPVKETRAPLPTSKLDAKLDDEPPPSRTDRSVNLHSDEPELAPLLPEPKKKNAVDGDGALVDEVRGIDDPVAVPDETEGAPTGLIVGGAIGGVVVVLAGAGVGGYFLVQALQGGGGGTVVITPR